MGFSIARVYDPRHDDGVRVLVDRLWPRGVAKDDGRVDRWLPEVAPSSDLRRWFGHDPARFDEFAARYRHELDAGTAVADLREIARTSAQVTLVYAARDTEHNHARVLLDYLETASATGTSPVTGPG